MDPNFGTVYSWIVDSYEQKGDYEQAIAWDLKDIGNPVAVMALREAYAASGWRGYWRKRLDLAQEGQENRRYVEPYHLAVFHVRLGEKEQAFARLRQACEERSLWVTNLKVDPKLDPLRSDPRFADLLRRVGLAP